jgi:pimeloyl-ACP methyl ester carboxylesterase
MPQIEVDGLTVAFRDTGPESGPGAPALLAHCSLAHSGLWKPILAALKPGRRALAPDLPAHGGTAPPPEGGSLQSFGATLCTRLLEDAAGLGGRPAHLVGLSLGGAVLGRVACARPDLVASVTLIEPVYFHLLRPAGRIAEAEEDEALMADVNERYMAGDGQGAIRRFMEVWGAPEGFENMGGAGQAYALACYGHLRRDWRMVTGNPAGQITADDLAALRAPMMLVDGGETPRAASAILDVIGEANPSARRRTIPGAGHLSPVTHWRAVLAELETFWAEAEARAAA